MVHICTLLQREDSYFVVEEGTQERLNMSTRIERLFYIAARIAEEGYPSTETLAELFEVNKRTILRDIEFLQDRFHAPIAYSRNKSGYYLTDPNWTLSTFPVTEGQLLALLLTIELVEQNFGTPFEQPLRAALDHISNVLTDEVEISVKELINHYSIRQGAAAKTPFEILLVMFSAISRRHPVEILYYTASRGVETQRVIYPYHVFNLQGEWQVIAYDLLRQAQRQFALQRIRKFRVLEEETFDVDPDFSSKEYFEQSFQSQHSNEVISVTLLFDEYQARYIREQIWHSSQVIEELPDGGIIMRFTTGAVEAVKRWILGYGRHVRVLSPPHLAQSLLDEFRASLAEYENS